MVVLFAASSKPIGPLRRIKLVQSGCLRRRKLVHGASKQIGPNWSIAAATDHAAGKVSAEVVGADGFYFMTQRITEPVMISGLFEGET